MLKAAVIALVCFSIFLFIHGMTFHFFANLQWKSRSIFVTFVGLIPCYGIFYFLAPTDPLIATLMDPSLADTSSARAFSVINFSMGLIFYAFLFLGYLEFYFTADRSITCRMLTLLNESADKRMTSKDFLERYDTEAIILRRLDDMTYGGYLHKEEDYYMHTKKGRLAQKLYGGIIKFLNLGKF